MREANKRGAGHGAGALLLHIECFKRAVPDHDRWQGPECALNMNGKTNRFSALIHANRISGDGRRLAVGVFGGRHGITGPKICQRAGSSRGRERRRFAFSTSAARIFGLDNRRYPGCGAPKDVSPERVASVRAAKFPPGRVLQPFQGWRHAEGLTQGSSRLATLGWRLEPREGSHFGLFLLPEGQTAGAKPFPQPSLNTPPPGSGRKNPSRLLTSSHKRA
jgi:hypothetical protein